jgi:hypothetical protein
MLTSPEIDKIAEALAQAQAEFLPIEKNKTVKSGSYSYKYADLTEVQKKTTPALCRYGISVFQSTHIEHGREIVKTRLIHKSGQWLENEISLKITLDTPQGLGSCTTYGRRYGLCAALNVSGDEDIDAADVEPSKGDKKEQVKKEQVNSNKANGQANEAPNFAASDIVKTFGKYGVTLAHLEAYLRKPIEVWTKPDIKDLVKMGIEFKEKKKDKETLLSHIEDAAAISAF